MPHRSIEEVIDTIAPSRRRGIPNPPTIDVGVSSSSGDLSSSLSQAGQQIAQLQGAYQQQANLIAENTQALQSNTSSQANHSTGSTIGHVASSIFGGAFGFLSPLISGITSLFGGSSTPAALPIYTPPSPVSINAVVSAPPAAQTGTSAGTAAPTGGQSTPAPHVTVQINAIDSKSFMDHSDDIASAVRTAMLNMHPINDVVANL